MVKKLLKHEFIAYSRLLIPMFLIMLGVSLLTRIVAIFENPGTVYSIVEFSSWAALIVAILVCIVMTVVFSITRFYKNLFTHEGYLSFTLPVTPSEHISTKLIVSFVFQLGALIASVVSFSIATFGETLFEITKAAVYIVKTIFDSLGQHSVWYTIEYALSILLALVVNMLLFYTCIALGQTFKKNRVLAAFGIYFAYYFISQIISTIFIIVFTGVSVVIPLDFLVEFINRHPHAFTHTVLWVALVFQLLLGALYFFITHRVIKKRLNLE